MDEPLKSRLRKIRTGTVREKKEAIKKLTVKEIKTLLNVMWHVLQSEQVERKYLYTYKTLLDKGVTMTVKKALLQKNGHKYLPMFLDSVSEDLDDFIPRDRVRTRRDCTVCNKKGLKKLSNHLKQVHGIEDRKALLQKARDKDDDENNENEALQ